MALVLALAEREALDEGERRRRDREIGLHARTADRLSLLRRWLAEAPSPALAARIRRVAPALRALSALVASVGLFLGWLAASTLLTFEVHEGRINIVASVAVLVLLPALMWLVSLLGWLVARMRRGSVRRARAGSGGHHEPSLGDWLRGGALGGLVLRALPQAIRQDIEVVLGRVAAHGRLYADVQQGQLLLWAQILGTGFAFGALTATSSFVVFTDLAFGWSTTLEVGAWPVHRIVRGMALPWAWLWPAASPGLELVEATRFFRVTSGDPVHVVDPIVYGGWWPFLVMAIVTYAGLPRVATAWGVWLWLSRATARAMDLTPGVDRLLDRLRTPLVETRAPAAEIAAPRSDGRGASRVDLRHWWRARVQDGEKLWLIRWAGAGLELPDPGGWSWLLRGVPQGSAEIRDAGGHRSLEDDAALLRACGRGRGAVVVWVHGYEPPLLDFLDFLADLRAELGPERELAVGLVGGREGEVAAWCRKLAARGDPRLVVGRIDPSELDTRPEAGGGR